MEGRRGKIEKTSAKFIVLLTKPRAFARERKSRNEVKKKNLINTPRLSAGSFVLIFLVLTAGTLVRDSYADIIYLKNGKAYEGELVGKSEKRFIFSVMMETVKIEMSFFPEEVEKIELEEESADRYVPYLKEVEISQFDASKDASKVYELSLYKTEESGAGIGGPQEDSSKPVMTKEEMAYYEKFRYVKQKYADKFVMIEDIYANLTTATRQDFARASAYMDDLYFELFSLKVPKIFKVSHGLYLEAIKAIFMTFRALDRRLLDEAERQIGVSENLKKTSLTKFRDIVVSRRLLKEEPEDQEDQDDSD